MEHAPEPATGTWWPCIVRARDAVRAGRRREAAAACEEALRALDRLLCSAPPQPLLLRARLATLRDRALLLGEQGGSEAEHARRSAEAFARAVAREPGFDATVRREACRTLAACRTACPNPRSAPLGVRDPMEVARPPPDPAAADGSG